MQYFCKTCNLTFVWNNSPLGIFFNIFLLQFVLISYNFLSTQYQKALTTKNTSFNYYSYLNFINHFNNVMLIMVLSKGLPSLTSLFLFQVIMLLFIFKNADKSFLKSCRSIDVQWSHFFSKKIKLAKIISSNTCN